MSDLSPEERAWYSEAEKRNLLKPEEAAWWGEYKNRFAKTHVDLAEDVGRSFVTGAQQGVAGLAGLPGDAQRGLAQTAKDNPLTKRNRLMLESRFPQSPDAYQGAPRPRQMRAPISTDGMLPGSRDVNAGMQQVFGKQYEPQTVPGEYARTTGNFAVNAALPGSILTRTARVVLPGVASEGAGQATQGTQWEGPARLGGALAGGVAAEVPGMIRVRPTRDPIADIDTEGAITTEGVIDLSGAITGPNLAEAQQAVSQGARRRAQYATEKQALELGDEFGIPFRRGQQTQKPSDISFEQSALRGAEGDTAYNILRENDAAQRLAVQQAAQKLATQGAPPVAENPFQAAGVAREGIDVAARTAKQAEDDAWDAFRASPGQVQVKGLASLSSRIEQAVRDFDINPDLGLDGYRQAGTAYERVKRQVGMLIQSGRNEVPISELNQIRKSLSDATRAANNDADRALASQMNRAMNEWLDDVSTTALFSGDDAVVENLTRARGLTAQYHSKFGGDKLLGKIVERNADERQTINALFGAAKIGSPSGSVQAIRTIKAEAPPRTVQALREAAIMRIFEPLAKSERQSSPAMYGAVIENLDDALAKSGRPLMGELFTAEELAKLRRLQMALRRLNPPAGTVNYSGTAYEAKRAAVRTLTDLMGKFGNIPVLNFVIKGLVDAHSSIRASSAITMRPVAPPQLHSAPRIEVQPMNLGMPAAQTGGLFGAQLSRQPGQQ